MLIMLFQSLGRDSVCSYSSRSLRLRKPSEFQSLGRDSVCSYFPPWAGLSTRPASFNPSVGILFVHTCFDDTYISIILAVSIPRSGFCLFILMRPRRRHVAPFSFNPSVGILFVHTGGHVHAHHCWGDVSIPRSGFCLFIHPLVGHLS